MENHSPPRCLDDLASAIDGGHNLVAYLVALLLYRHNGDADDDDTIRRYIRWVEGEEVSRVVVVGDGGGPLSRWLSNKGCVLCRLPAAEVVLRMTWGKLSLPSPTQVRGDLPCAGGVCGYADGWERRALYCNETVGFAKKSIFLMGNWNKKLVIHYFRM